jgi:hypothetical protein
VYGILHSMTSSNPDPSEGLRKESDLNLHQMTGLQPNLFEPLRPISIGFIS